MPLLPRRVKAESLQVSSRSAIFLPVIRRDIRDIIVWSQDHFGTAAADRYSVLIRQALRDVHQDPVRPGVKARPELAPKAHTYHLAFSRDRVYGEPVKTPRHFLLYRFSKDVVEFARLLHDSRDLAHHLPVEYKSSI